MLKYIKTLITNHKLKKKYKTFKLIKFRLLYFKILKLPN